MLQYTQNLFEYDRIWKQDKLILIRLLFNNLFHIMKHTGYIYKKNKTVSEAQEKVTESSVTWQLVTHGT